MVNEKKIKSVVRILSVDGGGIRGIIPAKILETIESIKPVSGSSIADYFDILGGTSTGGIITLGMALKTATDIQSYHYTAKNILEFYTKQANRIFTTSGNGPGLTSAQYPTEGIESFFKEKFGANELLTMRHIKKKLILFSYNLRTNEPFYIRSAGWYSDLTNHRNMEIWQAARATSAAPTYFPAINVDGETLIDGGIYINNPALELLLQARNFYPEAKKFILVSLGTGKAKYNYLSCKSSGIYGWLASGEGLVLEGKGALLNSMMLGASYAIHNQIRTIVKSNAIPVDYYRFNPELEKDIPLDVKSQEGISHLEKLAEEWCQRWKSDLEGMYDRIFDKRI